MPRAGGSGGMSMTGAVSGCEARILLPESFAILSYCCLILISEITLRISMSATLVKSQGARGYGLSWWATAVDTAGSEGSGLVDVKVCEEIFVS